MIWSLWFSLLLLCSNSYAAVENIDSFNDGTAPVVNENFRTLNSNVNATKTSLSSLSGYFTSGILQAAHGGTGQDSSAWTSGDYVYMSSTGVWGHAPLSHGLQLFSTPGSTTFTAPTGVTKVYLSMCGGGGGGAGGQGGGGSSGAGGGAGSSCLIMFPYTVVAGNSYTVTVGAAGTAGTGGSSGPGTSGGAGGSSVFDTITITGGAAGTTTAKGVATVVSRNAHATNGTAGSYLNIGGDGGLGNFNVNGGGGGGSFLGLGGAGQNGNGGATTGYGAGGASGVEQNSNPGGNGSAGGTGVVIVQY